MVWHFLRAGVDGARALRVLDDLIQPLGNSVNADVRIAVNAHLAWVENADRQTSGILESRLDVDDLYTTRYWELRQADEGTARPLPLIEMEQAWQANRLRSIRVELEKYTSVLTHPKDGINILCDTNVYMHGKLFSEVLWREVVKAQHVRLIVPLVVVDELDAIKDRGSDDARWARRVLKQVREVAVGKSGLGPFPVRDGVDLHFVDEPRGHIRLPRPDDEIVRQAEYFAGLSQNVVIVVTRDRGMLLRCQSVGVEQMELPEGLYRKREPEGLTP